MSRLRTTYLIAANTALLLCVVQVATHVGILATESLLWRRSRPAMSDAVRRNYAHMSASEVTALRDAFDRVRFRYEPVVGYMNAAISSPLVNVDADGIRANGPARRGVEGLRDAIWFLGGSTTFGEGVADHETIPAQLERIVGRPVINLGVRNYATAEENLLLNHYLRLGYRPAQVLFLDGINESCVDAYTDEVGVLFDRAQDGYDWDIAGPVGYAYMRLARKARDLSGRADAEALSLTCQIHGRPYDIRTLHARRLAERDAICRLYGVDCRTFVQPFAGIHGRHDELDTFFKQGEGAFLRELFAQLSPNWRDAGATFTTDALDGIGHHAYIDEVHYSAEANAAIAKAVAARTALTPATPP